MPRSLSCAALLCALALSPSARADDPALPAFSGYVVDSAHVLDPASVAQVKQLASRLDHSGAAQLAVATLPSLGDSSVEDLAVALFKKWGLGHDKKRSDGVLILYVPGPPGQRKTRVEVGYGLEGVLPDGKTGALIRSLSSPLVKQDQYGPAAVALASAIAEVIEADAAAGGDSAPAPGSPRGGRGVGQASSQEGVGALGLVVLFLGGMLVWLLITSSRRQFPGSKHAAGFAVLAGAALVSLLVLGGAGGWIAFVLGIVANGAAWVSIGGHRCPKCKSWMTVERVVVDEPTYFSSGQAVTTQRCQSCGYHEESVELLPRRQVSSGGGGWSSGGGDSDSGGWGGGDSGGGFSGGGGGESGGGGASSSD